MDNLDKLLEAIEHPENLSTEELQQLMSDPEIEALYRLLCASRSKSFSISEPDDKTISSEWNNLMSKKRKQTFIKWFTGRKASAVISFVILSYSIAAVGISMKNKQSEKTLAETPVSNTDISYMEEKNIPNTTLPKDTVIIFENEKLDKILNDISPYYNLTVDLRSPRSKEVRLFLKWDSSTPIDELIDHLNTFERINLILNENTLTDY